jgi:Ca2+-binding RTX toxin-like protein
MMYEQLEARRYMYGGSFSPLYIYGTAGADTITLSQSGNTLTVVNNGVSTNHTTYIVFPGSTPGSVSSIYGLSKVVIYGGDSNDSIKADETVQLPMEIYGGQGNDWLRGGFKNDKIYGYSDSGSAWGDDTIDGGSGNDVLTGSSHGWPMIWGSAGNDTITGSGGHSYLSGGDGNDSITGKDGDDYLWGGDGDDTLFGASGYDTLVGGDDDDLLQGGALGDSLYGGNGNDSLNGQGQIDDLNGDAGDDTLNGGDSAADDFSGGIGHDTADYSSRSDDLTITLDDVANDGAPAEGDNVHSDIEVVKGGSGDDKLTGNTLANFFIGNAGNDTIRGGSGNDTIGGGEDMDSLYGDGGNDDITGDSSDDSLFGGAGDDTLNGGLGEDVLVAIGGGNHDILLGADDDNNGAWLDTFWLDSDSTETHDATAMEVSHGHVHRVGSFANGESKELNGQDLTDPALFEVNPDKNDWSAAWDSDRHRFDGHRLYMSDRPWIDDVRQGALGDCWFLAALGAVAKQDHERIEQSIVDLGDGTYAVQFWNDGGSKQFYRVDNELPAQGHWNGYFNTSGIAYAQLGFNGDMWVPIMEKAFALFKGGYDEIDGGFPDEAYDWMGRYDNTTKDVDDDDALQAVANALAAGKAVTVNTSFSVGGFSLGDSIVVNHVYAVYSVDVAAKTIKVYNPWGTDAGTGPGAFVQGANDGFVNFTFESFQNYTRDFYIATL